MSHVRCVLTGIHLIFLSSVMTDLFDKSSKCQKICICVCKQVVSLCVSVYVQSVSVHSMKL